MKNPTKRASVLVVEDEWLVSDMVSNALEDEGFEVHVASNASEAIRLLASEMPLDLLFTDINLPGELDGGDVACCARKLRPQIPVVYASGRASSYAKISRVANSVFLPKPYLPAEACRVVAREVQKAA